MPWPQAFPCCRWRARSAGPSRRWPPSGTRRSKCWRPALEGRRLASRLAAAGIAVTYFSDAAISQALGGADAVVFGADAVAPEWFLNKSGTRMLAAAAGQQGLPVHVIATRDKFVSH